LAIAVPNRDSVTALFVISSKEQQAACRRGRTGARRRAEGAL